MLIVLAGLPEPAINHKVQSGPLTWLRCDTGFDHSRIDQFRLVIEYDGRQHAESDRAVGRRTSTVANEMDGDNWCIVIVRSKDIYNTPGQTLQRITSAMRAKGMAVPRLADEWRLHFPGRTGDVRRALLIGLGSPVTGLASDNRAVDRWSVPFRAAGHQPSDSGPIVGGVQATPSEGFAGESLVGLHVLARVCSTTCSGSSAGPRRLRSQPDSGEVSQSRTNCLS